MNLGICDACARLQRLREDGTVSRHFIAIPVSARAVRSVGAGRVRRRCPGSGKAPRRVER
jgi:hypothetical protein